MAQFKKILVLDDEIEAQLLASLLEEKRIPHVLRSYHDSALDGLYQLQKGWGDLSAPEEFEEEILGMAKSLADQGPEPEEEDEDPHGEA